MNELWNKYPYTDFHEMNLDWILSRIRSMEESIKNFINLNTIKYSDPIAWDITSQYESNTVVIDNQTGNAYISTKSVPSGVHISNTDYWTQIFNYANELDTLREQIAAANEKQSTTASEPRAVDDLVWVKGRLLKIIAPMIAGDSYVIGSNCVYTTIEDAILDNKALDAEIQARIAADNVLQLNINTEEQARIAADNMLQSNINTEEQARIAADNVLNSKIDNLDLTSYQKSRLKGKEILIIGDSLSDPTNYDAGKWVNLLIEKLNGVATVTNKSIAGRKMTDIVGLAQEFVDKAYDIIIMELGTNDWYNDGAIGNFDYGAFDPTQYTGAMVYVYIQFMQRCASFGKYAEWYYITPSKSTLKLVNNLQLPLDVYRTQMRAFARTVGANWINGESIPNITSYVLQDEKTYFQPDGIHWTEEYTPIFCDYVLTALLNGGDNSESGGEMVEMNFDSYITPGMSGKFRAMVCSGGDLSITLDIGYGAFTDNEIIIASNLPKSLFTSIVGYDDKMILNVSAYDVNGNVSKPCSAEFSTDGQTLTVHPPKLPDGVASQALYIRCNSIIKTRSLICKAYIANT